MHWCNIGGSLVGSLLFPSHSHLLERKSIGNWLLTVIGNARHGPRARTICRPAHGLPHLPPLLRQVPLLGIWGSCSLLAMDDHQPAFAAQNTSRDLRRMVCWFSLSTSTCCGRQVRCSAIGSKVYSPETQIGAFAFCKREIKSV